MSNCSMELLHEQCGNPEASQQQQETEREGERESEISAGHLAKRLSCR